MDNLITLESNGIRFEATQDGVRVELEGQVRVVPWVSWNRIFAILSTDGPKLTAPRLHKK